MFSPIVNFDYLPRLNERWRKGVPTIAAVVSSDVGEFVRLWTADKGQSAIVHTGPPHQLARTALNAFMASCDPVAAVAELVAEHTGQTSASVLARLRDASGGLQPPEFAPFGFARELQVAVASVLGPWRNTNELWAHANRMATVQLLDEARVAAGFARLLRPQCTPLLVAGALDSQVALELAAAGQRLVEAIPHLRLALVVDERTWANLERCYDHCWALVREGLMCAPVAAGTHSDRRRDIAELAALRDRSARDAEAVARAKSLAERLLFEALERRPLTAGRFTLNGRLDVVFGSSAAEIDLLDRQLAIAIEVDGFYHFRDPDAYRRDRRKDLLLQHEGYLVIRTLADDVLDRLEETVDDVALAVRRRLETRP